MKVTSWNVNSVRARLERLEAHLDSRQPDVLCLQETKVVDDDFPRAVFASRGYAVEVFGQRTYNGVAIASKLPMKRVTRGLPSEGPDQQRRVLSATVDGLRIVNVYVPNGKAVEDPAFELKLAWLRRLKEFVSAQEEPALVVCGDFNIAPEDRDVHDPDAWRGKIHFSDEEHAALADLRSIGLIDLFRVFHEQAGLYSWWDYRRLGFPKDRGLRIDYFLGTEAARERTQDVVIDREERKGEKPSDHAPVTATFRES